MHAFAAPVLRHDSGMRMHYVPLPLEIADALAAADVRIVSGTLGGVPFRRAIQGRGNGTPHLVFGQKALADAGLGYGDTAEVELEAAPDPDAVHLPDEFAVALEQDPEAAARFARSRRAGSAPSGSMWIRPSGPRRASGGRWSCARRSARTPSTATRARRGPPGRPPSARPLPRS